MRFRSKGSKIGGSSGVEEDDYWGKLYAHLCTCFGWTWEYIDECMTFERLESCDRYWKEHPPIHIIVADYMGYEKPKTVKDKSKEAEENCLALFNSLTGNADADNKIFKDDN